MINLNKDDTIIRLADNGWIVFHINDEGEPVDAYVFSDRDYTSAGEVIEHIFEDNVQLKRRKGFVLNWYPEGWEHPKGRPEVCDNDKDVDPEIIANNTVKQRLENEQTK